MTGWLNEDELRIGLGCMRLSTDAEVGEERGLATIAAAAHGGLTIFDTARAYGDNERLLARALKRAGGAATARIVTKGGMAREDGRWVPDGRARTILSHCEASLEALDGLPIDLYLIHAPDFRVPWQTTLRALRRLLDDKLVRRVGVSNVTRGQLEEAVEIAPICAVEAPLSLFDDGVLRAGLLDLCERRELALIAYSPLGGPRRRAAFRRSEPLRQVAGEIGASPAQVALAWLLDLSPLVVPIPGARNPDAAASAALAAGIRLDATHRDQLNAAFRFADRRRPAGPPPSRAGGEVVLIMGIPGAGKSRLAEDYVRRGYTRLNRDQRGGTLKDLAAELKAQLAEGARRVVLDNTYLTRESRSRVVEVAAAVEATARCVWLDTPLAQAQVNVVERLLDRFGELPAPETLRRLARAEPGLHTPTSQMRTVRELEPPAEDEGFTAIEAREFQREPRPGSPAVFVAASAVAMPGFEDTIRAAGPGLRHVLFDWLPDAPIEALAPVSARLARLVGGRVDTTVCTHPGGPPICWCRPPLPGLLLAYARAHDVALARSTVIGTTPTHRTLGAALGARYVAPPQQPAR